MTPPVPERRLRIAVLSRHFGRHLGGAENYSVSLAERLATAHEVHVFCQTQFNQDPHIHTHVMGIALKRPRWINMLLYSSWTAWKTRKGFDIVHSHENVWHGNVQTFHVKPVTHNLFYGKSGMARLWAWFKVAISPRLIAYLAVERARVHHRSNRLLITASALLKELYITTFGVRASAVHVLTPGVVLPEPLADGTSKAAAKRQSRAALGLPSEGYLLLMVGHNYQKKGLGVLLAALQLLPAQVSVVVVGDPSQIAVWQQKAQRMGVRNRVHFLGKQTAMTPIYRACDVFVHATLEDVFPIVVLEAMAHGLPVVISPAPFCLSSDLLTPQVNALVLKDPQNAQELSRAVAQLQANPTLCAELVANGHAFATAYSWDTLVTQQLQMYRKALQPDGEESAAVDG